MKDIYKEIKFSKDPFLIAEIGVNYYEIADKEGISLMEAAERMITVAAESGADAVKFQSYRADTIASKNSPAYWDLNEEGTKTQHGLFKKYDKFGAKEYYRLSAFSKKRRVHFLSTPFDFEAVDYLEELVPIFKIASADITNTPFIKYIARKNKPVILSTGAATMKEIDMAVKTILDAGNDRIALLHCVLEYPTRWENANLSMIGYLKNIYSDLIIGYSDHTKPDPEMLILLFAFLGGAKILEKHFTLDKNLPGNDHYHAMTGNDIEHFCDSVGLYRKVTGSAAKRPLDCEKKARLHARRSVVTARGMRKGEIITSGKVTFKRPGTGISPQYMDKILGRRLKKALRKDEILDWSHISGERKP